MLNAMISVCYADCYAKAARIEAERERERALRSSVPTQGSRVRPQCGFSSNLVSSPSRARSGRGPGRSLVGLLNSMIRTTQACEASSSGVRGSAEPMTLRGK